MAEQKLFSVVIAAWNEERTIKEVIEVFQSHPKCREVIVVSDGSTDNTANISKSTGARVLELAENSGKGEAMEAGIEAATMDVIFFSDADILGLTQDIVTSISEPVLTGKCAMSIGIQGRSIYWLNKILHFFPLLGGERVILKDLWYSVPKKFRTRFKIETALNYYSKKFGKTAHFTLFPDMSQLKKESKYGILWGFWLRVKMFAQVFYVSIELYIFDRLTEALGLRPTGEKDIAL